MKILNGEFKLGILGGGQLGRMLIQEAINYNLAIHVLDSDKDAPCRYLCNRFEVGDITDYDTVYQFGKTVNLLTVEIEKVNVDALETLEQEGLKIFPQPRVLRLIQDKGLQKQFFKENDIPTAPFQLIDNRMQLMEVDFTFPFIQKLRRDGYDGKGVFKVKDRDSIFLAFDAPCLVESMIDFEREISVIVARNERGEIKTFPVVDMDFNAEANLVEFLVSPSEYSEAIQDRAKVLATKIAEDLKIVGLLAVEMFLTASGNLLVNELAPRPHNSGHHTIEGNYTSQFEQHIRAILDMPLGNTDSISYAVMINLLGEESYDGLAIYDGLRDVLKLKGVYVHLYGKKFTKSFRKMGHVTILDDDRQMAIEKAKFVQQTIKVKA